NICKGNYVAFIDSDDMWIKNKLSLQMEKLEDGWDLVCSNFITFSNEKEYINARISPEIITYDMMLKSNFIGNLTGIYNREKLGIFNQVNEG
ncbi:glycosyltransferase, partial [Escherichia coli]